MSRPPALAVLTEAFGLSAFERDLLLLCAGFDLDALFQRQVRDAVGGVPDFSQALALLQDPHWSALAPSAPLRRWQLLELASGLPLLHAPLHASERVLHFLSGVQAPDPQIEEVIAVPGARLPVALRDDGPAQADAVEQVVDALSAPAGLPARVQLLGHQDHTWEVARMAAETVGLNLAVLHVDDIPGPASDRMRLARLWEREAVLSGLLLLLDADPAGDESRPQAAAARFLDILDSPALVAGRRPLEGMLRPDRHIRVRAHHCQDRSRRRQPRLERLTERLRAAKVWDDLVLPVQQHRTLLDIASHARLRHEVHDTWGFAEKTRRGLGISALFAGPSGTGKTMAAEGLAELLQADLYRIDLGRVVSKYIGETEKNLGQIFDEAQNAGDSILLFDEADALFGRRSEVHDSHDRYANLEVSYLLQCMETYDGLAILTTNAKSALDPAFLRRLRFVVTFPFPDITARALIWQRAFPGAAPVEGLDYERLAALDVSGGNIRNIALNAAFAAAASGAPIRMAHLAGAARQEYAKLERALPDAEIRSWT
jgi:hypothetical protein